MNNKPNILFIFADQQHWQAMGCIDPSFNTPHLDRFANESTLFTEATCTTPQCSPSRSSILTGLYPSKTGVAGNCGSAGGNELKTKTIGAILQEAGYRTGFFGKWHLGEDPVGTAGWDENRGPNGNNVKNDAEATECALTFLEQAKGRDQPFALFVSYNEPHDIYLIGREKPPIPKGPMSLPETWYKQDFNSVPPIHKQFMEEDQGRIMAEVGEPGWKRYRELYREKVALYDREAGAVLDAFREHPAAENTLIVVTSDHGDMDGQHQLIFKGPFLYDHLLRIPLMIQLPASMDRSKAPKQTDFQTVNVDLVPTLADIAGLEPGETDGLSLKPLLTGAPNPPDRQDTYHQYYSKQKWVNPVRTIRNKKYKYNLYQRFGEELYDLEKDPLELENRANSPDYAAIKTALKAKLEAWILANDDPFFSQTPTTRSGGPLTE